VIIHNGKCDYGDDGDQDVNEVDYIEWYDALIFGCVCGALTRHSDAATFYYRRQELRLGVTLDWIGLDSIGLEWGGLDLVGLHRPRVLDGLGLGLGSDRIGLDWNMDRMDWNGISDWISDWLGAGWLAVAG
jgi:hypothetical protein